MSCVGKQAMNIYPAGVDKQKVAVGRERKVVFMKSNFGAHPSDSLRVGLSATTNCENCFTTYQMATQPCGRTEQYC
jgi:hypothetical protein